MPTSFPFFKEDVKNYIVNKVSIDKEILDIGPGQGTYAKLLDQHKNIDAVEVWAPYITKFKLETIYRNITNMNVSDYAKQMNRNYDLIIMGDILEHLIVEDAQQVLDTFKSRANFILVAVPYKSKQSRKINTFENHLQEDLTHELFMERYSNFEMIFKNKRYGYYWFEKN